MTGLQYEIFVAKYLESCNYTSVEVTKGSGDYGVDVIAYKSGYKYAIQCKYYTNAVGIDAIQQVVAGMAFYKCNKAIVITNSTFTNAAQNLAQKNNVILMQGISPETDSTVNENNNHDYRLEEIKKQRLERLEQEMLQVKQEKIKKELYRKQLRPKQLIKLSLITIFFFILLFPNNFSSETSFTIISIYIVFFLLIYIVRFLTIWYGKENIKKNFEYRIWLCKFHVSWFVSMHRPYKVKIKTKDNDFFEQSDKDVELRTSNIIGVPHLFTIDGHPYNIDILEDIENFPLVFTPIIINETEYYFNNYFRMCAKLYKDKGYNEHSVALLEKAAFLEASSEKGSFMRSKAKFYIKTP